jgi:hypothetical protein
LRSWWTFTFSYYPWRDSQNRQNLRITPRWRHGRLTVVRSRVAPRLGKVSPWSGFLIWQRYNGTVSEAKWNETHLQRTPAPNGRIFMAPRQIMRHCVFRSELLREIWKQRSGFRNWQKNAIQLHSIQ